MLQHLFKPSFSQPDHYKGLLPRLLFASLTTPLYQHWHSENKSRYRLYNPNNIKPKCFKLACKNFPNSLHIHLCRLLFQYMTLSMPNFSLPTSQLFWSQTCFSLCLTLSPFLIFPSNIQDIKTPFLLSSPISCLLLTSLHSKHPDHSIWLHLLLQCHCPLHVSLLRWTH